MTKVAVLDDWQGVARTSADWSPLQARAEVVFFAKAFDNEDDAARQLADFDIILSMRERTPLPASLSYGSTEHCGPYFVTEKLAALPRSGASFATQPIIGTVSIGWAPFDWLTNVSADSPATAVLSSGRLSKK